MRRTRIASRCAIGVAGPFQQGEELEFTDTFESPSTERAGKVVLRGKADGQDGAKIEGDARLASGDEVPCEGVLECAGGSVIRLCVRACHARDRREQDEKVKVFGQKSVEVDCADCLRAENVMEVRDGGGFEETILESVHN